MNRDELIELLINYQIDIEVENPIDWESMNLDKDTAYRHLAGEIVDLYIKYKDDPMKDLILLSALLGALAQSCFYATIAGFSD